MVGKLKVETKFNIPPKSRFRGLRLDPEIVELVIELNKAGFPTYNSCVRNIRIENQMEDSDFYKGKATLASFDPIGDPKGMGDGIIDQLDRERQLELFVSN